MATTSRAHSARSRVVCAPHDTKQESLISERGEEEETAGGKRLSGGGDGGGSSKEGRKDGGKEEGKEGVKEGGKERGKEVAARSRALNLDLSTVLRNQVGL